jgi:hypothetical protein
MGKVVAIEMIGQVAVVEARIQGTVAPKIISRRITRWLGNEILDFAA